ncbi:MAG TPA: carboxymuconolactone decarboxylase family protein [Thermoguttaceae bacterium]|nr:carboxymuconolactone decarboxylase family protein [Thermoguttaceae bacterium]
MPRLRPITYEQAPEGTRELLDGVMEEMGMVPNIFWTLANSPTALEGFVGLHQAIEHGVLSAKLREEIALTVSEMNQSHYCVCGHAAIGRTVGCSEEEIMDARRGTSPDSKVAAALHFAREIVNNRGCVSDDELRRLRGAGYEDREITEIVACVALYVFGDYFTHIAQTEVDFPEVPELVGT